MDQPDVVEQIPQGGGVNTPASGTYGEGAALQRLQAELPGMESSQPQEAGAAEMAEPYEAAGSPPPGLPPSLLAPSNQPNVPTSTPLEMPVAPPQMPTEQRIMLLQALQQGGSDETREWATLVLNKIIRSARA